MASSIESLAAENNVSIEEISDHGKVLIAKRDFNIGDIIWQESPLLRYDSNSKIQEAFDKSSEDAQRHVLGLFLGSCPRDSDIAEKLQNIDRHSAFDLAIQGPFDSMAEKAERRIELGCGLFKHICRASHACLPNASPVSIKDDGTQAVICLSDISRGDEIKISYLAEHMLSKPSDVRKKALRERWEFECRCARCSLASPDDLRAFPCKRHACDGTCCMRNGTNELMACSVCDALPGAANSRKCVEKEATFRKYVEKVDDKFNTLGALGWILHHGGSSTMQEYLDKMHEKFQKWFKPQHYLTKPFAYILRDWATVPLCHLDRQQTVTRENAQRLAVQHFQSALPNMQITLNHCADLASALPIGEERDELVAKAKILPELKSFFQRRPAQPGQERLCSLCMDVLDKPGLGRVTLQCNHCVHDQCEDLMKEYGIYRCPACLPLRSPMFYGLMACHARIPRKAAPSGTGAGFDTHEMEDEQQIPDANDGQASELSLAIRQLRLKHAKRLSIVEYSRDPTSFHQLLLTCLELKPCRDALILSGFCVELESGAKAFVYPDQYEPMLNSLHLLGWGTKLRGRHVIVDVDFEEMVKKVVQAMPRDEKVKRGRQDVMPLTIVKRTFIEVQVESSLRSEPHQGPVTASTSDAHGIQNPRQA